MSDIKTETIEDFLARGGKVEYCKPYMPKQKHQVKVRHFDRRLADSFLIEKQPKSSPTTIQDINISLIPDDLLNELAE